MSKNEHVESNEKTTNNQKNTKSESTGSGSQITNVEENNKHIVKNDTLTHCNKMIIPEIVEQVSLFNLKNATVRARSLSVFRLVIFKNALDAIA
jgi:hypothetical protein